MFELLLRLEDVGEHPLSQTRILGSFVLNKVMFEEKNWLLKPRRFLSYSSVMSLKLLIYTPKQDPEVNDASSSHFFIFLQLFHFFTLLIALSSTSILSPRSSFLLVPPSSSFLLPPRPSFFLVQHCLNHLESVKGHFSLNLTKALRTDGWTDPHIEMRGWNESFLYFRWSEIPDICDEFNVFRFIERSKICMYVVKHLLQSIFI